MNEPDHHTLLKYFKAVGQQERLKILGLLASRSHTIAELTEVLGVKGTDVLHHLRKLQETGLVTVDWSTEVCQLCADALETLHAVAEGRPQTPSDRVEHVLERYVKGSRLKQIPTDPEERAIILQWLAKEFEMGRRYSESKVNEIIARRFHKQEMLRRYLIDGRFLKRAGKIYWRSQE